MRILAITALALATVATPAFAQDSEKTGFGGASVGAVVGIDHVKDSTDGSTGVLGGVTLGYDFDAGGVVIGADAEADLASTKDCVGASCVKAGRDLYVGGRIGAPLSENLLFYGKVGYTNARVKGTVSGTTVTAQNLDGIRAGVGLEVKTHSNLFGRIEYRYSNYEQDVVRHQGVAVIGVRF